jgi:hypothetical protein
VKSRFQSLPFKRNLHRYNAELNEVGRCKLNSVDPRLESDWFQTLTFEAQSWFQNVPIKSNLRHLQRGAAPVRWGLYKLNPVLTHSLKGAWFQPLNLWSENPVSNFAFSNATCTATVRQPHPRCPPRRALTPSDP